MKPMNLQVTKKFYKKIRLFFFPENDQTRSYPSSATSAGNHGSTSGAGGLMRTNSDDSASDIQSTTGTISTRSKLIAKIRRNPPSTVSMTNTTDDRLMMTEQAKLMAERAQNNHSFVYIKIPQGTVSLLKFHLLHII